MSVWTCYLRLIGATIIALTIGDPASAQTKLRWAHVYEITEPYHTEALWAASEIKKRTNGKFDITVFPASQLGNENQLNEALGFGAIDIVYVGINFVAATYPPLGISGAPFMLRDLDHWKAYRDSKLFSELVQGYDEKTPAQDRGAYLLRPAPRHRQQADPQAGGHEGHETAGAAGAAVSDVHQIRRRRRIW